MTQHVFRRAMLPDGRVCDVGIADGRIDTVRPCSPKVAPAGLLMPGLLDVGTHLRDPGRAHEETLPMMLRQAARGGFTAVVPLASTQPVVDGVDDVEHRIARASRVEDGAALLPLGALTTDCAGAQLSDMMSMAGAGAVGFSDLPTRVKSPRLLRRAMEYAAGARRPVFVDARLPGLADDGVVAEGDLGTRLGLPGVPVAAETARIALLVDLAALTGARVVIGPVATAAGVHAILDARARGIDVWARIDALHLVLDERELDRRRYDTRLRLDPPLQPAVHVEALRAAVGKDGVLVSSGHRPVSPEGKEVEFARAEPGAAMLTTALSVLLSGTAAWKGLAPAAIAHACATVPGALLGRAPCALAPGGVADLVWLEQCPPRPITDVDLRPGMCNHPLRKQNVTWGVMQTLRAGELVYTRAGAS